MSESARNFLAFFESLVASATSELPLAEWIAGAICSNANLEAPSIPHLKLEFTTINHTFRV